MRVLWRVASAVVLVGGLGASALPSVAEASVAGPHPTRPPAAAVADPGHQVLAAPSRGPRAVRALGDRLPAVARRNGLTPRRLSSILEQDRTAWLDRQGRLYYVEPLAPTQARALAQAPATAAAPYPLDQTFQLNSLPGSARTIFLDFDGATVTGTAWNAGFALPSGAHQGWSLDADYATFSDAERTVIQGVWQRVAEDYAPFDVNVTTQDPGAAVIDRSSSSDSVFGTRALISRSASAWAALCDQNCGGIAYLGVFDSWGSTHAYYQPAWVFPDGTGNDAKGIAEATAHEVGHNFGLSHDGTASTDYYLGHTSWAPIMGAGYYQPITQWDNGTYLGANNTEDDLAVIAAGGAPVRADEAGGTTASAAADPPVGTAVIGSRTDVDVFALPCTGATTVSATPAPTSPNLDIEVTLLSGAGTVLATGNPASARVDDDLASGLSATASTASAAAYVRVDGVGSGDTRYSDYGSLGAYRLALTCPTSAPSAPTSLAVTVAPDQLSADVTWGVPVSSGDTPIVGYQVTVTGRAPVALPASARALTVTGLSRGQSYQVTVAAVNGSGPGRVAAQTLHTLDVPGLPALLTAAPGSAGTLVATWSAPDADGGSPVTGYDVWDPVLGSWVAVPAAPRSYVVTGVVPGTHYALSVRAVNAIGAGPQRDLDYLTPAPTAPTAPVIRLASAGRPGGPITAKARWYAPDGDGGSAITGAVVKAARIASDGRRVNLRSSPLRPSGARGYVFTLPRAGVWQFRVRALNAVGWSPWSGWSNTTLGR